MYQTPLQQYVYVMLYKIMNAKSCITPTQCMADEITQSCAIPLHGNREGSLHQSKSAGRRIVGVSCRNLSEGTPQPWPGEPWEPTKEKKNLFICVVPTWDAESHLHHAAMVIPVYPAPSICSTSIAQVS